MGNFRINEIIYLFILKFLKKIFNSIVIIENFKFLNCKNMESNHGLIIQK